MSIRVLGSDDGFIEDQFYCTGIGAIGEFNLDFPDLETAIGDINSALDTINGEVI